MLSINLVNDKYEVHEASFVVWDAYQKQFIII